MLITNTYSNIANLSAHNIKRAKITRLAKHVEDKSNRSKQRTYTRRKKQHEINRKDRRIHGDRRHPLTSTISKIKQNKAKSKGSMIDTRA